jgi:hypothetical protein
MSKKTIAFGSLAILCLLALVTANHITTTKIEQARQALIPPATEITFLSDDSYIMVQNDK